MAGGAANASLPGAGKRPKPVHPKASVLGLLAQGPDFQYPASTAGPPYCGRHLFDWRLVRGGVL